MEVVLEREGEGMGQASETIVSECVCVLYVCLEEEESEWQKHGPEQQKKRKA